MISQMSAYRLLSKISRWLCIGIILAMVTAWAPVPKTSASPTDHQPQFSPASQISYQRPTLRATINYNRVVLRGSNYRPNHVFYVKMTARGFSGWIKLENTIQPKSNGTIEASVRLPSRLRDSPRVKVCLKEVYRGYTVCTTAKNYY